MSSGGQGSRAQQVLQGVFIIEIYLELIFWWIALKKVGMLELIHANIDTFVFNALTLTYFVDFVVDKILILFDNV